MLPLTDIFAALRWWLVLTLLGAAATPLAYDVFRRLADRGYAFTKMLGLLVASYLFWLLSSLGFLANNHGGILVGIAGLLAISAWSYWRTGRSLLGWLRDNRRQVLLTELVFGLVFVLWVWVRAQNPAITATEKPMEFAFLNAVGRSASFPPLDPWLSGYAISYYYFGYVMISVVARLAAVTEPIAFNLGIAWLAAGAAVGAFGLVYNLVASSGFARRARILALVAALALPIAGNLEILMEVLYANGVGTSLSLGTDPATGAPQNLWQWLDIRDLNRPLPPESPRYTGNDWWWWRSSRVINEYHLSGRPEEGLAPIAEFPGFSFVLGDMHPHVLALPFAFLSLALAYAWWLRPITVSAAAWRRGGVVDGSILMLRRVGWPIILFTALVLGGLSFLNTWDVFIHLFVILGAFVLSQWREHGRWDPSFLAQALLLAGLLVLLGYLLYLPFYLGFRSQAGPPFLLPMLMRPTRLPQFLVIFGMPLTVIFALVGALAVQSRIRRWRLALSAAGGLLIGLLVLMLLLGWVVASSPEGAGRVVALAGELGVALPARPADGSVMAQLSWGLTAVAQIAPAVLVSRIRFPGVTLLLSLLVGGSLMLLSGRLSPSDDNADHEPAVFDNALPFVLLLILTGALLTLGPEFVYLRDNFGFRLNTVFKFYYQAWVMFGVAALVGLDILLRRARPVGIVASTVYGVLLVAALLFPAFAVTSRAGEYRNMVGGGDNVATLNGLDWVRRQNPDEYEALIWLRRNVEGTPVILEAVGGQYSSFGRVAAATGLPTVLGWAGHEYQWRGSTPEPGARDPAVRQIYQEPEWMETPTLLNRYDVEYIYLGHLETSSYGGPQIRDKFERQLEVAYRNNSVTIFRWLPVRN